MNEIKKGFVLWFTGLPCSGKTTIADNVAGILRKKGLKIERLDGDIVRESLSSDLGFSREDRDENIRRVIFVSRLLSRNGVGVITSFVSPYRSTRQRAREETTNFIEAFTYAPLRVCISRDVKGMYEKARKGEIENFTGVSDPYQEPRNPDIFINTEKESLEESSSRVISYLELKGYINPAAPGRPGNRRML